MEVLDDRIACRSKTLDPILELLLVLTREFPLPFPGFPCFPPIPTMPTFPPILSLPIPLIAFILFLSPLVESNRSSEWKEKAALT